MDEDDKMETLSWKLEIKNDFEEWIDELSELHQEETISEEVDLYSFYEELCVLRNEVRKGGRRNQEVLTRFGDGLSDFQKTLSNIQDRFLKMDTCRIEGEILEQKEYFLPLVHILERMERLKKRLYCQPQKTLFNNYENWQKAWNSFKEGYEIIFFYLNDLLKNKGISRIETIGLPFDPEIMAAVAVETSDNHSPDSVIEEISAGFLFHEKVIKMAEVKVVKASPHKTN